LPVLDQQEKVAIVDPIPKKKKRRSIAADP